MLAKLLDIEESRPGLRGEVGKPELEALFTTVVQRALPRHAHPEVAAGDLFAITRGMVDAAGERGETNLENLERRLRAAIFGYLSKIGTGSNDMD